MARPLRGGGGVKARPLRNIFEDSKKFRLPGHQRRNFFVASLKENKDKLSEICGAIDKSDRQT